MSATQDQSATLHAYVFILVFWFSLASVTSFPGSGTLFPQRKRENPGSEVVSSGCLLLAFMRMVMRAYALVKTS